MAKSYSLQQAAGMRRYGSLININPSAGVLCITAIRETEGQRGSCIDFFRVVFQPWLLGWWWLTKFFRFFSLRKNIELFYSDPPGLSLVLKSDFIFRTEVWTDGRTLFARLMTTYLGGAWWVKNALDAIWTKKVTDFLTTCLKIWII